MGKKAHIICAKCGSDNVYFDIDEGETPEGEEYNSNVSICCNNCAELTGIEEWNEFNDAYRGKL